jgi:hypothetical protein
MQPSPLKAFCKWFHADESNDEPQIGHCFGGLDRWPCMIFKWHGAEDETRFAW